MNNLNAISENLGSQKNFVTSESVNAAGFLFWYLLLHISAYCKDQYSKVEGSGFGTFKLFWNKNSAK